MKRRILIVIGILLAIAATSAASIIVYEQWQDRDRDWDETLTQFTQPGTSVDAGTSEAGVPNGDLIPLEQALELAAGRVPGEVLKVELDDEDGRIVYEIKVLADNGRVREIKLDARSGKLVEIEDD